MKKFNSKKISLTLGFVLVIAIIVFGLARHSEKNRIKEVIVDLGSGWKSYSHEDVGITVKIPDDAEVNARVTGYKNENFDASFSKGDIKLVRATYITKIDNPDDQAEIDRYFSGDCNEKKYEWHGNKYTIGRSWCEKVMIDGKTVKIVFSEAIYKSRNEIGLSTHRVAVLGKTKRFDIMLKPEATVHLEKRTEQHQNFTEKEVNDFVEEKIQLVKDLVLSIDNF